MCKSSVTFSLPGWFGNPSSQLNLNLDFQIPASIQNLPNVYQTKANINKRNLDSLATRDLIVAMAKVLIPMSNYGHDPTGRPSRHI